MSGSGRLKHELALALELLALTAVAFSRPVLEGFGGAPVVFTTHRAAGRDLVWFGILVVVLPALVVVLPGVLIGLAGERPRAVVHLVLVGLVAAVAGWRLAFETTSWGRTAWLPLAMGTVAGLGLAGLRWWPRAREATATFLRFAGAASVVFLGNFVFLSETARSDLSRGPSPDMARAEEVAAGLPADAPPVVVVVFDALPTATLLDGDGRVDAELFPNFARLADDATWYRNHTTVASFTTTALPALLTGRYPGGDGRTADLDENLFSLLGAGYEVRALEAVTDLCHRRICTDGSGFDGQGQLLSDAVSYWRGEYETGLVDRLPLLFESNRFVDAQEWIAAARDELFRPSDRPPLLFSHFLLPHAPWEFTDEGVRYSSADSPDRFIFNWKGWGATVGRQAHVLQTQAADRLLGELLDALRDSEIYDDAVVVVTADHGEAFLPHTSSRGFDADNLHQIMWTPLLVKAPGQTEGTVDDGNVQLVDIVPTIAHLVGAEIPWEVDGVAAEEAAGGRDADKPIMLGEYDPLTQEHGAGRFHVDGEEGLARLLEETAVEASGSDAVWKRTAHGDLLRTPVAELPRGEPVDGQIELEIPSDLEGIDLSDPLPMELLAETDLEAGTVVALALNDQVAAVAEVVPDAPNRVHALVLPDLFVAGDNELTAYVVTGTPDDEILRPVNVRS